MQVRIVPTILWISLTVPGLCAATSAIAADIAQPLRSWLLAIEAVPNAEQVRRAGGAHTEALLDAVIRDTKETSYARHRALSFLSLLDTPAALHTLRKHLMLKDDSLRATAAVAWASGPGRRQPQDAWPDLDRLLADRAPQVRAAAARALALAGDGKGARDRALRRRARESVPEVQKALDRAVQQLDAREAGARTQ